MRSFYEDESRQLDPVPPATGANISPDGRFIDECLGLYFKWQNPYYMIVDRNTFLVDYLSDTAGGANVSLALVHSACALGALMSPKANVRQMADSFYQSAENLLLGTALLAPDNSTIQALLCCAFYETGRNNPSKAWMYSGMISIYYSL